MYSQHAEGEGDGSEELLDSIGKGAASLTQAKNILRLSNTFCTNEGENKKNGISFNSLEVM